MKAFKAFIKPFKAPHRIAKIKIEVSFFSLPGIGPGRVNFFFRRQLPRKLSAK